MEKAEMQSRRNLKPVVIAVGVALGVLVIGCTIFLSVFLTHENKKLEWIAFNGGFPHKQGSMHEECEVDHERRTVLHINAEGWKIGVNNSMSLHDYKQGLLASRIMETGTCLVIELTDTYEEASAILGKIQRAGEVIDRPAREFNSGTLIPQEDLVQEIGERLANFCSGAPTYRLHEVPSGTLDGQERDRRRRAATRLISVSCFANTFRVSGLQ